MQPIKYLNGLGEPSQQQLMKYDYIVIEDANGNRQTIPNPLLQQGVNGLGFISSIIGAGAKLIGGFINKRKQAKAAAAAPAPPPAAAAAPAPQQGGFLRRMASNLIPQPAAAGGGGLLNSFAGGSNSGLLSQLQSQVSNLQNSSSMKENAIDSFVDKQKEELAKQNNLLTQSNSEVQRLLDNADAMRRETEGKVQELKELLKAQETKQQLSEQEHKLKEQIRQVQQPDQTGKILTYVGIGAAALFALKSLNGTALSGTDAAPTTGKKSNSKIKTVTI